MDCGYCRTSTADQIAGLQAQERDLSCQGVEKIFKEHISGASAQRPQLEAALDFLREGDTLVVTKLDRLARSTRHLLEIVETLEQKRVALRVLDFGGSEIDTRSPQGRLTLTVFGAFAEFERALMLERQREGIEKAKRDGKYRGRKPLGHHVIEKVKSMKAAGVARQKSHVRQRLVALRYIAYWPRKLLQESPNSSRRPLQHVALKSLNCGRGQPKSRKFDPKKRKIGRAATKSDEFKAAGATCCTEQARYFWLSELPRIAS